MKYPLLVFFAVVISIAGCKQQKTAILAEYEGEKIPYDTVRYAKASDEAIEWWKNDRFGLFVHWGVYSVAEGIWSHDNTFESRFSGDTSKFEPFKGYGERLMEVTDLPKKEYEKLAGVFDWSKFNAQDYIDLCFASGQRYITITTKHHDGFAIWPSKASEWNIGNTPYGKKSGRDPLKELADACHATKTNGSPWEVKMCFYYSHCADWWEEDAAAFGYAPHTDPTPAVFQNYLDRKVKPQLKELLTNYGEIGMIWFDVPRVLTTEQAIELREFVHDLSPNTLCSGRLGHDQGNYVNTGDNGIVGIPIDVPWETGSSINESFAIHAARWENRSSEWMTQNLIRVICNGGNYLLNVGPRADGTIPQKDIETLSKVGDWLIPRGEAVYGTKHSPYTGDKFVSFEWGSCTQKGNSLYMFVTNWPDNNQLELPLLQNKIKQIRYVGEDDKNPLKFRHSEDENGNDVVIINIPEKAPNAVATVIKVECKGERLELAPYKHHYDANNKQIFLSGLSAHAYTSNVKYLDFIFDKQEKALTNWRRFPVVATLAWTYNVPEDGEYVIELDYSVQSNQANVDIDVLTNNVKQISFKTKDTGGFDKYERRKVGKINLKKGRQDIALQPTNDNRTSRRVMQLKGIYLTKIQ
jgi:alpha-L-fucosidase